MLKTKRLPLIIIAVGFAVSAALILGKSKPAPIELPELPPPTVPVLIASPAPQKVTVLSQGEILPKRAISLVAEVSGQITEVSEQFVEGGFFSAGEALLQIDSRDYRIAISQAESLLADAQQQLALEKGRALQAKREWRDLGNTEANDLFLRKPQLASAKAAKTAAEANLELARINLERTTIKAPFNGRLTQKNADLGQYLNKGSNIASLFSTESVEIKLPLTAQQLTILGLNTAGVLQPLPAELSFFDGYNRYRWQAELIRMDARVDTTSRLYYAIAQVKNPYSQPPGTPALEPGMFVQAQIVSSPINDALTLPKKALLDNTHIFLVSEHNQLIKHKVQIVQQGSSEIVVRNLQAGARIVIEPPGYLNSGDTVSLDIAPAGTETL